MVGPRIGGPTGGVRNEAPRRDSREAASVCGSKQQSPLEKKTSPMNVALHASSTQAAEGLPRRRFTVAEVEAMVEAGIMDEDERSS